MKRRLIVLFLMMVILSSCIRGVKDSKTSTLNDYDQRNEVIFHKLEIVYDIIPSFMRSDYFDCGIVAYREDGNRK